MKALQEFRHYQLSETADGRSIELARSEDEVVCLSFDVGRQFFVAMHVLAEDFEDRMEEEVAFHERANDAKTIRHPNVAVVYEAGEDEGTPYFVTELVGGEPLENYLVKNSPVPEGLALHIVRQLAQGAQALAVYPELLKRCDIRRSRLTAYSRVLEDLTVKLCDPGVASRGSYRTEGDVCKTLALIVLAATGAGALSELEESRMKEVLANSSLGGTVRRMITAIADGEIATIDAFARGVLRCIDDGGHDAGETIGAAFMPAAQLGAQLRSAASIERVLGEDFKLDFDDSMGNEISGWGVVRESDGVSYRVFQLPPNRLCEVNLIGRVEQAAGDRHFRNLRKVASLWPDGEGGALYAERDERLETLAVYCQRQGGLTGDELIWVSGELHRGLEEANEAGFEIWGFGARAIYLCHHGEEASLSVGTTSLSLRGHPTLEALTEPGRFANDSIGPERAMVAPDDYDAFVNLVRSLPIAGSNPLMESAIERFFSNSTDEREVSSSASQRRIEFIRNLDKFFDENGLRDDLSEGEGFLEMGSDHADDGELRESPGVAEALFGGGDEVAIDGWNPIAQSVAVGGDDDDSDERGGRNSTMGWVWFIIGVLFVFGASLGALAYFFGWI